MVNCPKCDSSRIESANKVVAGFGIIVIAGFLTIILGFLIFPLVLLPFAIVLGVLYMIFGKQINACKDCKNIFLTKPKKQNESMS